MNKLLLIFKAVLVLLPIIREWIEAGKIKTAEKEELLDAFQEEYSNRIARARTELDKLRFDEDEPDPNDRASKR